MTSEVAEQQWQARYPDLTGKVAVVAGASSVLRDAALSLNRNGVATAIVCEDRELVAAATDAADQLGIASLGIVADAGSRDTWDRVTQHIEQRLGPIDIAVVVAPEAMRMTIVTALLPDMAARKRGVIVEAGATVASLEVPSGLRHRAVRGGASADLATLAAAITWCASDVVTAPNVSLEIS